MLQNVTVCYGCADFQSGSGILNGFSATLMIQNSTISGNTGNGGSIANGGTLEIQGSMISGNTGNGGGIMNEFGCMVNASFVTIVLI